MSLPFHDDYLEAVAHEIDDTGHAEVHESYADFFVEDCAVEAPQSPPALNVPLRSVSRSQRVRCERARTEMR